MTCLDWMILSSITLNDCCFCRDNSSCCLSCTYCGSWFNYVSSLQEKVSLILVLSSSDISVLNNFRNAVMVSNQLPYMYVHRECIAINKCKT